MSIISYKNISIHYSVSGKGKTIVLLHGFLENLTLWNDLSKTLENHYHVVRIDLLGHGKTGCLGYIHTMEQMAEAVKYVLESLKITKVTVLGHSMGGYVALAFAEKFKKDTIGLILLNATAYADSAERKINRNRAILTVKQNHRSFIRIAIPLLFRPKNRKVFIDEIKSIKNEALKTPLQGIIAALEGMKIRSNREVVLQNNILNKLMVIGKKDPVLDYKNTLKQTTNTSVKVFTTSGGHMSFIENKEETFNAIKDFLKVC